MLSLFVLGWVVSVQSVAMGSHQGHEDHPSGESTEATGPGLPITGASFQVYVASGGTGADGTKSSQSQSNAAARTVVDAFSLMMQNRTQHKRFDEALTKEALQKVVIEPKVVNRDGKEFTFLVARTKEPGKVKLLISASALEDQGYLHHPEKLVPALAREFQWVVSKASTAPKPRPVRAERNIEPARILTNKEISGLSGEEREGALQALFETYLTTVDGLKSLDNQPYYEVGTAGLVPPAHPDSTTKLYDIRVREALQKIVREPYFMEHTPKAVRSLLNGSIWTVTFVKIDERDWATRTRVQPKDQAVSVGKDGRTIQPAKILVNTYRTASPEDPFYSDTDGLPMGALSADKLARVIAWEIQNNIVEKSMQGHVAQDELTSPEK